MPTLQLQTSIKANMYIVFDLSRSIDLQSKYVTGSNEEAVAGRTTGLISFNETVTYRGKHLGVWQSLTSKVINFDRPHFFADEMQKGAFKSLRHEHYFIATDEGTLMKDVFDFESPLGVLGKLAKCFISQNIYDKFPQKQKQDNQRVC